MKMIGGGSGADGGGGEKEWDIQHVFVTSDEPQTEGNPFWKQVFGYGWVTIDHAEEKTTEKYGPYVHCLRFMFLSDYLGRTVYLFAHFLVPSFLGTTPSLWTRRYIQWRLVSSGQTYRQ